MAELQYSDAQRTAITDRGGALLVSAAAGAGKTFVLVERLMHRILSETDPCNIDDFLIITFTRKAAGELRARITGELTKRMAENPEDRRLARQLSRVSLAKITTIDGFCSDLIRRHAFALDIPSDFRQLETAEAEQLRAQVISRLLEQCYAEQDEESDFRLLADTLGAGKNDEELQNAVEQVYLSAQSHLSPRGWMEQCIDALRLEQYRDAAQTPWGAELIDAFGSFCEAKERKLRSAIRMSGRESAVLERYGPILAEDVELVRRLRAQRSWDALAAYVPDFKQLPSFKKNEQTELQTRVKGIREQFKKELRERLGKFYADSEIVMAELAPMSRALRALFALALRFEEVYLQEKLRLHLLDFSDLEHFAAKLLLNRDGTPSAAARELSEQFTELMLDEYQDTNEVQDRIFRALSRDGKNRFMVGDVKQAIYRFRLADPGIFLKKYRSYPPAELAAEGEPRKVLLSSNYRSGPEILDAANAVFRACMSEKVGGLVYGESEQLRPGKPHTPLPGPVVELHCIHTKAEDKTEANADKTEIEAEFTARRIRQLLDEQAPVRDKEGLRPVRPEDVVILLRSAAHSAQIYIDALRREGIACVSDSEGSLLDTPEIELLRNLLCVIDNARQDIPLTSVLLSPLFAMPADTLAQIRASHRGGELWDALCASALPQAQEATALLRRLRDAASELELPRLLQTVAETLSLGELCDAMPDGALRRRNLEQFYAIAAEYSEGGRKSLSQFLAKVDVLCRQVTAAQPDSTSGAVTLMTIHKSKGLEFPVVVLGDLSREFSRKDYSGQVLLHPELGAGSNLFNEEGRLRYPSIAKQGIIERKKAELVSEELRVLYVAMTRPKDRLIMLYSAAELPRRLRQLTEQLTLPPAPLLAAEAKCPGDWVLETALLRKEATELFAVCGEPDETERSEIPWRIRLHRICALTPPQPRAVGTGDERPPQEAEALHRWLDFRYPGQAATTVPAKLTATQLKGRDLDAEAAEKAELREEQTERPVRPRALRKPYFGAQRPLSPTERGIATHLAMQYLDYAKTGSLAQLEEELRRLVAEEFLTPQQAEAVSAERLFRVFAGPLGARIAAADRVVRELKFSLLTDAKLVSAAAAGEQLLMQGVTDCCLIKDGRLTVIDFKTDRIAPGGEASAAAYYRGQLAAYSEALERMFGMPVEERLLYFFQTDTAYPV